MSINAITWAFRQRLDDPTAKLVLVGIADKYNEDRGYAWPSISRLAEMADCTERTVTRKIALLEERGLVQILRQPPASNRYFLPTLTDCHPDTRCHGHPDTRDGVTLTPDVGVTIKNDIEQKESIKSDFDRFWNAVPRKVGKKAALNAFKAALKSVEADILIDGMEAYAKKVRADRTEPRYIAHPTTWLQQGRWDDEEAAQPSASAPVGSRGWVPATQEEFMQHVMNNPMRRDWLLQNRPGLFHDAIQKGWIHERPKQQRTFG